MSRDVQHGASGWTRPVSGTAGAAPRRLTRWGVGVAALAFGAGGATEVHAQGTVTGRVRDTSGIAIAGAEVAAEGGATRAQSGDDGAFRLTGVPAGAVKLQVRRLGFRQSTANVTVTDGATAGHDFALVPVPQRIEAVTVREQRREVYDGRLAGFYRRQEHRSSGGYFVTRDAIDRSSSLRLTELLRGVPGVRIGGAVRGGPTRAVRIRGNGCAPLVFVDGFPAGAGEFDLDMIDTKSVEGVEIYGSIAGLPPELTGPEDRQRCGVIAVWSQPYRPKARAKAPPPAGRRLSDIVALLDSAVVFTAEQVEAEAQLVAGSWVPAYPDSLWKARVGGRVVSEFIVDTAGAVEMSTFAVVSSTSAALSDAVRATAAAAQFQPARRGGQAVRQLVHLPHVFAPADARRSAPDDSSGAAAPTPD